MFILLYSVIIIFLPTWKVHMFWEVLSRPAINWNMFPQGSFRHFTAWIQVSFTFFSWYLMNRFFQHQYDFNFHRNQTRTSEKMWGFPVREREFHCIWSVCKGTYFAVKAVNCYGDWITGKARYVTVIAIFELLKKIA